MLYRSCSYGFCQSGHRHASLHAIMACGTGMKLSPNAVREIWRPPYEAHFVIIQAASGCTWKKCRFCCLYKDECFRMSPMEEPEEDLEEIKSCQP